MFKKAADFFRKWKWKYTYFRSDIRHYRLHLGHVIRSWKLRSVISGGNFEFRDSSCRRCRVTRKLYPKTSIGENRLIRHFSKPKKMERLRYKNRVNGLLTEFNDNCYWKPSTNEPKKVKGYIGSFSFGSQTRYSWIAISWNHKEGKKHYYYDVYWSVIRIKDYLKNYKRNKEFFGGSSLDPYYGLGLGNLTKYEFAAVGNNKEVVFFNVKRNWLGDGPDHLEM